MSSSIFRSSYGQWRSIPENSSWSFSTWPSTPATPCPMAARSSCAGRICPTSNDGRSRGDYVRLSVIDTGVGMPPEILSRVFEPFFTTKDIGEGSGLGLAQVHGFATQSRGTVRIQSEVGRGTSIELLPAAVVRYSFQASATSSTSRGCGQRRAIRAESCWSEDDDEVAALVSEMLSASSVTTSRAPPALPGLWALLADGRSVDVVFSDIMMPGGMNGSSSRRRSRRRRSDIPVLLTSGYAEAGDP